MLHLPLAHHLADQARQVALTHFRTSMSVESKGDRSPVTAADRRIERLIRGTLQRHLPEHGVFGEEEEASGMDRDWVWVIDPIDGTKAFVAGFPLFGCLIALAYCGRPVLGIIEVPVLRERFVGLAGHPTQLNGKTLPLRSGGVLEKALLSCTSPEMFSSSESVRGFARLRDRCRFCRYGADCYGYGMMSAGFVDLIAEGRLEPYDYMALIPVVEGVGGKVSDWQGEALTLGRLPAEGLVLAAGDPLLHARALGVVQG